MWLFGVQADDREFIVFARDRNDRFAIYGLAKGRGWPIWPMPSTKKNRAEAISVLNFERRLNLL